MLKARLFISLLLTPLCLSADDSSDDDGSILSGIRERVHERTQEITDNSPILGSDDALDPDAQEGPAREVVSTVTDPLKEGVDEIKPTKAAPMTQSGFLQSYSGFTEDPETGTWLWSREKGVLANYNHFIIAPIVVYPADDAEFKAVNPDELKKLTDYFQYELTKALDAADYAVVHQPGEGVAILRIAIVGVVPGNPILYAGSFAPYARIADAVKGVSTGTHMGVGSISIEAEMLDSLSGQREGAAIDTLTGGKLDVSQSMTKWGDIGAAVETWAQRFAERVEKAHREE